MNLPFCIVIAALVAHHDDPQPDETYREQVVSILKGATRVEVFRVAPRPDAKASKTIDHYPVTTTGKEQGQEFASKLSAILMGKGVVKSRKECGLDPGVGFRIWKGREAVDVVVCFKCDVLRVRLMNEDSKDFNFGMRDFDDVRPALLRLAKEAFPMDEEIQSLGERRRP
jgi:hypothetical protein